MDIDYSDEKKDCEPGPFALPRPNAKLRWWREPRTEYAYSAYIVQAAAAYDGGDSFTFRFVHRTTGKVSKRGPHKIDLRDTTAVWRRHPSTLIHRENLSKIKEGECAFLFLRKKGLSEPLREEYRAEYEKIVSALADTGGGTGKWPKTAGSGDYLTSLVSRLQQAISQKEAKGALSAALLKELLADATDALEALE